jgi:hypothetical protein
VGRRFLCLGPDSSRREAFALRAERFSLVAEEFSFREEVFWPRNAERLPAERFVFQVPAFWFLEPRVSSLAAGFSFPARRHFSLAERFEAVVERSSFPVPRAAWLGDSVRLAFPAQCDG